MSDFCKQIDEAYSSIESFLNEYSESAILQSYFIDIFKSCFYANLINLFFINLNKENVKEFDLPRGKIGQIKKKFKDLRKEIKLAFSFSLKNKKIDGEFYDNFKKRIKKDFPEFQKITQEIEKKIELKKTRDYLKKKAKLPIL